MRALSHAAAALALALLVVGSLVHQKGASLACPDWPLCNGTAFPEMTGLVAFEHGHRLVALAVTLVLVALAAVAWRKGDRALRAATLGSIALVVVQAGLGATTVLLKLPPSVSTAHLATAMSLLGVLGFVAARTTAPARGAWPSFGPLAALALAQCVLGALVRHLGAALACHGFPLCSGALLPDLGLARLHMLHRAVALVLFGWVAVASVRGARAARGHAPSVAVALAPLAVACAQVGLGITVVLTGARFEVVTVHHAAGAALVLTLGYAVGKGPFARGAAPAADPAPPRSPRPAAPGGEGAAAARTRA